MSNEKIIKKQAREALKGNMLPIIAAMAAVFIACLIAENLFYVISLAFRAIDLETETAVAGGGIYFYIAMAASICCGVMLSPFLNGLFKVCADTAVNKSCDITDVFYFFQKPGRYSKTLQLNALLFVVFGAFSLPAVIVCGIIFEAVDTFALVWLFKAILLAAAGIYELAVYLMFIHYPLAAYALDDSSGVMKYVFGYIGFSFKNFGKTVKLFFSLLGWAALCFFVVPALYSVPYILTASMNSARWLFEMDQKAY